MQDMWISVKSIKNHVNRHYGFVPYVAVCRFRHGQRLFYVERYVLYEQRN